MKAKLLILLIFFLSTAVYSEDETVYEEEPLPIEAEEIITNVLVSFVFYDTTAELQADFDGDVIAGISYCLREPEVNMAWCTIYQVMPEIIDGVNTLTMGHEVEHGVFGIYHEDEDDSETGTFEDP